MIHRSLLKFAILTVAIVTGTLRVNAQINAEQVVRVGQNALYFEDYMLSIQYFNQAIQAKPYLAQPFFLRSIAKLNLEDYRGAEEDASAAIERNPFIADAYEVRGVARQNLGKLSDAVSDYDEALKLIPHSRGILFNKALAQEQLNQLDSAAHTFDRLLNLYPNYENGYVGRARLMLQRGDTIAAKENIDHALQLNKNLANAYLLRADLALHGWGTTSEKQTEEALTDLSEAIRLQPREAGLYVNRAYLRYNLDDYFGAMADYDYAIQLDPLNVAAIYNRGLLRMEVKDNDHAIEDFTQVLQLDPDDYRALYNRALLYRETRAFQKSLDDINRIIDAFPEFPEALYMRSDIYRSQGKMNLAERDYRKAFAIAKNLKATPETNDYASSVPESASSKNKDNSQPDKELNSEAVARRFTTLRTIENNVALDEDYNNKSIRGRVQDRESRIEIEPIFALSYYSSPTELKPSGYYMKEVDEINATRLLRFIVQLTNVDLSITEENDINRHFQSIEYYNSFLATHTPRAIDYFGRAMDFIVLRNYQAAIDDLTKAIALTPSFALAYFERAVARYNLLQTGASPNGDKTLPAETRMKVREIIADIDKTLELSPHMAFAFFNKGNLFVEIGDYTSALSAYNKAIELTPDFGEAYYNRGYVYFQLGNREKGAENLSKAGELGVVPSYNLLKKMN